MAESSRAATASADDDPFQPYRFLVSSSTGQVVPVVPESAYWPETRSLCKGFIDEVEKNIWTCGWSGSTKSANNGKQPASADDDASSAQLNAILECSRESIQSRHPTLRPTWNMTDTDSEDFTEATKALADLRKKAIQSAQTIMKQHRDINGNDKFYNGRCMGRDRPCHGTLSFSHCISDVLANPDPDYLASTVKYINRIEPDSCVSKTSHHSDDMDHYIRAAVKAFDIAPSIFTGSAGFPVDPDDASELDTEDVVHDVVHYNEAGLHVDPTSRVAADPRAVVLLDAVARDLSQAKTTSPEQAADTVVRAVHVYTQGYLPASLRDSSGNIRKFTYPELGGAIPKFRYMSLDRPQLSPDGWVEMSNVGVERGTLAQPAGWFDL